MQAKTIFRPTGRGLGPIKRLWQYLVRQEEVQKHFVKFIFGKSNVKGGLFGGDGPVEVQSFVGGSEGVVDDIPIFVFLSSMILVVLVNFYQTFLI